MGHDTHQDEQKEPATLGQVILAILAGGFPVYLALFLVYLRVKSFH